jgi:membrane protein DedA with SNARE-associated domain
MLWSMALSRPYLVMFVLMALEGPLATIASGMLVTAGTMAFPAAAALAIAADVGMDSVIFLAGRLSRRARTPRLLIRLGLTEQRRSEVQATLSRSLPATLLAAKVADAAAVPVIATAGWSGVAYRRFLLWNLAVTAPKATLLLTAGAVAGHQILPHLTPLTSALLVATVAGIWLTVGRLTARRRRAVPSTP